MLCCIYQSAEIKSKLKPKKKIDWWTFNNMMIKMIKDEREFYVAMLSKKLAILWKGDQVLFQSSNKIKFSSIQFIKLFIKSFT